MEIWLETEANGKFHCKVSIGLIIKDRSDRIKYNIQVQEERITKSKKVQDSNICLENVTFISQSRSQSPRVFGQRQDTELWNNQFPESKIL